jgi:hypothetical protein
VLNFTSLSCFPSFKIWCYNKVLELPVKRLLMLIILQHRCMSVNRLQCCTCSPVYPIGRLEALNWSPVPFAILPCLTTRKECSFTVNDQRDSNMQRPLIKYEYCLRYSLLYVSWPMISSGPKVLWLIVPKATGRTVIVPAVCDASQWS